MRLIDADALIDDLSVNQMECAGCPEPEWIDEMIRVLEEAPTINIQTEVSEGDNEGTM